MINPTRIGRFVLPFLAAFVGCGGGGGGTAPSPPPPAAPNCDTTIEFCGAIPQSANACTDTQYWPFVEQSGIRPLNVHYSRLSDQAKALEMIDILEDAWTVQVDTLGFSPPLDDGGACGPDGRYDVFIWRSTDGAFVDAIAENPATPHDDYSTYMALTIVGSTGNAFLDTTLAHELNHALQASDDWWESAAIFEMSATFVEALTYPQQDDYFFTLEDFQDNPDWSLFYDDGFATWYMYGAAMYLHYLYERYYPTDPGFIARMWNAMRSPPTGNRPDFLDAIRAVLLADRGITLEDSVVEFSQWRWFIDQFDDGMHFSRGSDWQFPVAFGEVDANSTPATLDLSAMMMGANYFRFSNNTGSDVTIATNVLENDPDVNWNLSTADGSAVINQLNVPAQGAAILVAIAMPVVEVHSGTLSFATRNATLELN